MKTKNVIKILKDSSLSMNGYAFQSSTHKFDVFTNNGPHAVDTLFVKVSKRNGSDYDAKTDYNQSINVKTLKELKNVLTILNLV